MDSTTNVAKKPSIRQEEDGRTVLEQNGHFIVLQDAEHIQYVIEKLRYCYDYCAVWKGNERSDQGLPSTTESTSI